MSDTQGGGEGNEEGNRRCVVALLAAALLAAGCTLGGVPPPSAEVQATNLRAVVRSSVKYQKEYLLVAGDQVEVLVWRNSEVSRTVVVRPDGYISLPLLQEVKAAGRTPRELAQDVAKAYSGRLVNPEVTVIPLQVRQPMVYVLGDVRTPGAYPLRTAGTAIQALAAAGGALRSGWEAEAALLRLSEDGYLAMIPVGGKTGTEWFGVNQVNPYRALAGMPLTADDVLFIPETGRSQLFRALSDILIPYQIYLNYRLIEDAIQ